MIIRSHLYFLLYFYFFSIFESNDGPQICRSVFNISTGPRTRHLRNPYTAIEAFILNTRDAKVVKIEHRFTFADKLEGSVLFGDEYRKTDSLRKKYALMEFKVKK